MICSTQVRAPNAGTELSRLPHTNTSSRTVLTAMIVCPNTTATSDTMRMTSIARSRAGGVCAAISAGLGNSATDANLPAVEVRLLHENCGQAHRRQRGDRQGEHDSRRPQAPRLGREALADDRQ